MVPSRSLARQVAAVFSEVAANTHLAVGVVCGECGEGVRGGGREGGRREGVREGEREGGKE